MALLLHVDIVPSRNERVAADQQFAYAPKFDARHAVPAINTKQREGRIQSRPRQTRYFQSGHVACSRRPDDNTLALLTALATRTNC